MSMNEPGQVIGPMHPGETLGDVIERARIRRERKMEAEWAAYRAQQRRTFRIRATITALWLAACAAIAIMGDARAATSAEVEREISAAFERSEFSAAEQWALAGMVLADIAGNESTIDALSRGCRESNPLYGSKPNRAALYGVDALVWGAYWWAARRPGWRVEWFAYVRGALSARQAWSNYRTEC